MGVWFYFAECTMQIKMVPCHLKVHPHPILAANRNICGCTVLLG